jgi:hypothetical protein
VSKATIREATAEAAGKAAAADLDGLKKPAMALTAEKGRFQ